MNLKCFQKIPYSSDSLLSRIIRCSNARFGAELVEFILYRPHQSYYEFGLGQTSECRCRGDTCLMILNFDKAKAKETFFLSKFITGRFLSRFFSRENTVNSLINDESLTKSNHQKLTRDRDEFQLQIFRKILLKKVLQLFAKPKNIKPVFSTPSVANFKRNGAFEAVVVSQESSSSLSDASRSKRAR